MAGNKKPRKAYRPKYEKGTLPLTIRHSHGSDLDLQLVPHKELEKLRQGTADDYTINTLAFRLNWGYVMAGEVYDAPIERDIMLRGLNAIRGVKNRLAANRQVWCQRRGICTPWRCSQRHRPNAETGHPPRAARNDESGGYFEQRNEAGSTNMNAYQWPDGTPRSQGNPFTSWQDGRPSILNTKNTKLAEAAHRSKPGKPITIGSATKAKK